jgi:signal transduction histidine kinase
MALGSSARKDRFLSLMSFELRTPLTAILGYSELLSEVLEDVGTEDDVADTRAIETSSRRLLAVVDDIVDLSQIGAGTLELRDAPVDLTAVVNRALDTVRAENPTVQVSAEIARTGLIMGDHERLGRLVSNLVGQVVKGSATGERAHVLLTSRVRAVSLIVESPPDRADGEAIRRLRQGLQQPIDEKPVHLGLELTVADSLARAMGGELSVDRGARGEIRFIVTLAAKPAFATEGLRGDAA